MPTKSIVAVVEPIPNYILHLLAGSRVVYDGAYAEKYELAIYGPDRDYLQSIRGQLGWGAGYSGELAELMVFLPMTLGLETIEQFDKYFELVYEAKRSGVCTEFHNTYREQLQKVNDTWVAFEPPDFIQSVPSLPVVQKLQFIVGRNWDAYLGSVWPLEEPRIRDYAHKVNEFYESRDTIGDWERITGFRFKTGRDSILLTSAIENGPNANSAGYDKNVFTINKPFDWTLDFISHEVGTHLFIDKFRALADSGRYEWNALYAANESLAQFVNTIVLGRQKLAYDLECFEASKLLPKFRSVYERTGGFDYERLIEAVIELPRTL